MSSLCVVHARLDAALRFNVVELGTLCVHSFMQLVLHYTTLFNSQLLQTWFSNVTSVGFISCTDRYLRFTLVMYFLQVPILLCMILSACNAYWAAKAQMLRQCCHKKTCSHYWCHKRVLTEKCKSGTTYIKHVCKRFSAFVYSFALLLALVCLVVVHLWTKEETYTLRRTPS